MSSIKLNLGNKLALLFYKPLFSVGICLTLIASWVGPKMVPHFDMRFISFMFSEIHQTTGIIEAVDLNHPNSRGNYQKKIRYSTIIDGIKHTGVSYSMNSTFIIGEKATIEYIKGDVLLSRIKGTTISTNDWSPFFLLFLIIPGPTLFIYELYEVKKTLTLLRNFTKLKATFEKKSKLTIRVGLKYLHSLRYNYSINKKSYRNTCIALYHETFRDEEYLICCPDAPQNSIMVQMLPSSIRNKILKIK